jgi:hypothetical protein
MSVFRSAYCVPQVVLPPLTFSPPVPLDVFGVHALAARPELALDAAYNPGGVLGFSCSTLNEAMYRNWAPYAWDVIGSATVNFNASGYVSAPGPVEGGLGIVFDGVISAITVEWEQPEDVIALKVQPDFSRLAPERLMIDWLGNGGGYYSVTARATHPTIFPVFTLGGGGVGPVGWYIEAVLRIYGTLTPYIWKRGNEYLCEHDIRVETTLRCVPGPGDEPTEGWLNIEGGAFGGWDNTIRSNTGSLAGEWYDAGRARITDITGADPVPEWGFVPLYTEPHDPVPGRIDPTADLGLRIRTNHTPHPGY